MQKDMHIPCLRYPLQQQLLLLLLLTGAAYFDTIACTSPCHINVLQPNEFQLLELHDCRSYDLGHAVGTATRQLIQERFAASKGLAMCNAFAATPAGQQAVATMLQLHSQQFPEYIAELRGLAAGAGVPFQEVLLANMRQELLAGAHPALQLQHEDSCSDVLLSLPPHSMLLGHNEDMTLDTQGRVYFVRHTVNSTAGTTRRRRYTGTTSGGATSRASISSRRALVETPDQDQDAGSNTATGAMHHASSSSSFTWLGFVYAGELASSGFGFNSAGIGFTLNAVFPAEAQVPGISRNFVSRQLLEARSIPEALAVIGQHGQAVGHSYNLFDVHSKRMLNVEVGPGSVMSVVEVRPGSWYFHANSFKHLVVQQRMDNSSYHREARVLQLQAPRNEAELLAILGDTADPVYPIYRDGSSAADSEVVTLCTALVDLQSGVLVVWTDNPAAPVSRSLQLRVDLKTLRVLEFD